MSNEMPSIDTSGIEALRKIKSEQDVFKGRLEKMQEMRNKVAAEVYEKVFGEYSDKLDSLSAEAEPLKTKIRGQYQVLKTIMDDLDEQLKATSLEKEELELRHSLGEFEGDFFKEQSKAWEMKYTAKQAELDDAGEMKELFLSVFDSMEDLESDGELATIPVNIGLHPAIPQVEEPEPEPELEPEFEPEFEPEYDPEAIYEDEEAPDLGTLPSIEADLVSLQSVDDEIEDDLVEQMDEDLEDLDEGIPELDEDLTEDLEDDSLDDLEDSDFETGETEDVEPPHPPALPNLNTELEEMEMDKDHDDETLRGRDMVPPALPDGEAATMMMPIGDIADQTDDPEGTMIIANPKIISLNHATKGQVIVLGMGTTSIGRSPESDIHLTEDRISRKHSQITFGPGGYAIYDLNSENGSYVNGNRVREHFLKDGDILTIGTYKYQYRDR